MADGVASNISLPARFAEVYEEVARIKFAIREGRLPLYLGDGKEPVSAAAADLAAMVSQRLKQRMQQQARLVKDTGTESEIEAYETARYVMAALIDELFILEMDWPGRDAWQDYLLERSLYGSDNAGRNFFVRLDELLQSRVRGPMQDDLAAVFLFALQLGFKGRHRGRHGAATLQGYRNKLIQFLGAGHAGIEREHGFTQAYQYTVSEPHGERLAPLSRWYRFAGLGLLIYVAISTAVWLTAVARFVRAFNGG